MTIGAPQTQRDTSNNSRVQLDPRNLTHFPDQLGGNHSSMLPNALSDEEDNHSASDTPVLSKVAGPSFINPQRFNVQHSHQYQMAGRQQAQMMAFANIRATG